MSTRTRGRTFIGWLAILAFGLVLAGCGGGGEEYDETKTIGPPDCKNFPERCK